MRRKGPAGNCEVKELRGEPLLNQSGDGASIGGGRATGNWKERVLRGKVRAGEKAGTD